MQMNQNDETAMLEQFRIEELEQRLEMKLDWQQNGSFEVPFMGPSEYTP
jgi:hypothetical protein